MKKIVLSVLKEKRQEKLNSTFSLSPDTIKKFCAQKCVSLADIDYIKATIFEGNRKELIEYILDISYEEKLGIEKVEIKSFNNEDEFWALRKWAKGEWEFR